MMQRFIALTGVDDAATQIVTDCLAHEITRRNAEIFLLQGVRSAHEARAVYANHGELWCVGDEPSDDELTPLIDRTITGDTPEQLRSSTCEALDRFLGKTQVAA